MFYKITRCILRYLFLENGKLDPKNINIIDILQNTEFAKKLFLMRDFIESTVKTYLGVDLPQLRNEIAEEMKKNSDGKGKNVYTRKRFA